MEAKISDELRDYMRQLGARGGSKCTPAQTLARQLNGRLGGYPKGRPRLKPHSALVPPNDHSPVSAHSCDSVPVMS